MGVLSSQKRDRRRFSKYCRLIAALVDHAKKIGCYKVILDCSEENVAFYQKGGFERKEVQMVMATATFLRSIFLCALILARFMVKNSTEISLSAVACQPCVEHFRS